MDGIVECEGSDSGRESSAVEETEVLLGRQLEGLDTSSLECGTRRRNLPGELAISLAVVAADLFIAKDSAGNIGERRQI